MKRMVLKLLGKDREPLKPRPKLEAKQMELKDFNIRDFNNLNNGVVRNVMDYLDVDYVSLERGGDHGRKR